DTSPSNVTFPTLQPNPHHPSEASTATPKPPTSTGRPPLIDLNHINFDPDNGIEYDPPYRIPGLTEEEFDHTWYGEQNTIRIGVLLPFSPNPQSPYLSSITRINLSVLRMAIRDMNNAQIIPGMNMSLIVRDSQQHIPGTNVSGGAAAISATTRILNLGVGGVIGDIASDLTTAEAIMTSSVGVPQCSFASYNMDATLLSSFVYLFRTVPRVTKYIEALALVVKQYKWTKVSVVHTSDIPGILAEKAFTSLCALSGVDVTRFAIPLQQGGDIVTTARSVIRSLKASDTRIHVLAVPRSVQIPLLEALRDHGLFTENHVWMTSIDLTDSLSRLPNSQDFNGLIMADALWYMPGLPEYDRFVTNWQALDPKEFPGSGSPQLTWHETFAYTCVQVLAEGYKTLVQNAMTLTNETARNRLLYDIRRGKRSQDLTMKFLSANVYNTPVGKFTVNKADEAITIPISIATFQNSSTLSHGKVANDKFYMFNDIIFNSGTTTPPSDVPKWEGLSPSVRSPFGMTLVILTSLLMLAILITATIVIVFRDNIVIKSASPLFCILELFGLAITLSWIYFRVDLPSPTTCRMGLTLVVVGLTINLSALVVKNYRIYRIFNSVRVINHAVSNRYLLRVVAIPVFITIIPCLIRCFYHYLVPTLIRTNDNEYWVTCTAPHASRVWDIIVGAMPIIINIFGIYLAFKTRNVTRLWNEARSIAITIYLVSFFVIIIIIVKSFPSSLFKVTYHVTLVSVFLSSLIEYLILFWPKLRDLWLQRRGLSVASGRYDDVMDSILGGISAALGGTGGPRGGGHNTTVSATTLLDGGGGGGGGNRYGGGSERRHGSSGELLAGSAPGSISSAEMRQLQQQQQQQQQQQNPDISDLVSSYPLGQLNSDRNVPPMVSPVHRPTIYEPSSTLTNRAGRKAGGSGDQEGSIDPIKLPEAHRLVGRSTGVTGLKAGGTGVSSGSGGVIPPVKGYDTFVRDRATDFRNSRDAQPVDLHEALMPSSNNRRSNAGLLAVSGSQDLSVYDFFGNSGGRGGGGGGSGRDLYSRNSNVEYDALGMMSRLRSGLPGNRSLKLYPLQTNRTSFNGPYGAQSSRHSLRERRTDSFTVTAPVQKQRWYVMRFLAQWRMSKIIFVPNSKLLVIVDLETEKAKSLIVHTIEKSYSSSDPWTTTDQAQHINTNIYPFDMSMSAPGIGTGPGPALPPIKAQHLQQQPRSPLALPTAPTTTTGAVVTIANVTPAGVTAAAAAGGGVTAAAITQQLAIDNQWQIWLGPNFPIRCRERRFMDFWKTVAS
ncbi:hypothetical protein BGX23_011243, partial [Mortierella sp. AD031]